MARAVERIFVQVTAREKKAIAAKAKQLGLPISELMRRGATAYKTGADDDELIALSDAARVAAGKVIEVADRIDLKRGTIFRNAARCELC